MEFNISKFLFEEKEENSQNADNTFVLYHGGKRWVERPETIIPAKKGRYEHGVGIYLTNSFETARKYAKGSNVVQRVTVDKNLRFIEDVKVPLDQLLNEVLSLKGLKKKSEIISDLKRYAERTNAKTLPLDILNTLVVNHEAGTGSSGLELVRFFREKGVDSNLISQSSGEKWLVLFNPGKIKKVEIVSPQSLSTKEYLLPIPF